MDFKDQYGKILLIGIALLFAFVAYKRSHTHDPVVTAVDSQKSDSAILSKTDVENIVRDYILANPEVIITSMKKHQKRELQEMHAKTSVILKNIKGDLLGDKMSPVVGDGSVDVVMIFDYNCSYCKRANKVIDKLLEVNENVKVTYKPYPILSESSEYMSKVILAVNKLYPDQFRAVHSAFMEQKIGSRDDVVKILENYKVSVEDVEAEFDNAEIKKSMIKLAEAAHSLKIQGVPVFIIGNELYPGMLEYSALEELIKQNTTKKEEAKSKPKPSEKPKTEEVKTQSENKASDEAKARDVKKDAASEGKIELPPLEEIIQEDNKDQSKNEENKPTNSDKKPEVNAADERSNEPAAIEKEQKEVKDELSEEFSKFMKESDQNKDKEQEAEAKTPNDAK